MKTTLTILFLTCLGLTAENPPPPAPAAVPTVPPAAPAPAVNTKPTQEIAAPAAVTNAQPAAPRRPIPPATRGPAVPPAPAVAPAAGPGTPGAVTLPASQAAPTPAAPTPGAPAAPAAPPTITPAAPSAPTAPATPANLPAAPAAPTAPTVTAAAPAPEEIAYPPGHINFSAADLNTQVLPLYAEMVGRSILRPATLPAATIIFKNQTPLTKDEAIQALNAVLLLNGIAMVNVGDKFVKALPVAQAGGAGAPIRTNDSSQLPELGGYHTHVVQLHYVKPSEILPVIQPFASVGIAPPIAIESSQMLVIRDSAENVKRMLEMIEKVDVTVPSEFISEVIPIKFARVEDIADALNSLSGGGGGTTVGGRSAPRTTGATGMPGLQPGQPGYTPGQTMTPGTLSSRTGRPSSPATFGERIRQIVSRAASSTGAGDLEIIGVTKIVADARSNSLLIFATRQDMEMIKDIVSKLDVVLAQVLIETIIMDVSLDDTFALGVSAVQTPRQFSSFFSGAGGMNLKRFTDIAAGGGSSAGDTNAFTDLIGTGLRYFGKVNDDIYIQIEAAATDGKVNVIQKPRIQTSHATPAAIFIGNTVPYVTGSYYGGYNAGSSYQQLRVGIGLNVTPFINADGLVVMQIDETIDEISGSTTIENVGAVPNTTSRTLSAEVAVRDGETIILGGFIRNSETLTKSGVPFLKDIPLLGYLFRSTGNSKERKELIVLMRPTVLRTPEAAAMQVSVEKERLPGVRAAEADLEKMERSTFPRSLGKLSKEGTPFTPEEELLYGKPAPTQPPAPVQP